MKFEIHKIIFSLTISISVVFIPPVLVYFFCLIFNGLSYTKDGQFAFGFVLSIIAGLILGTGVFISSMLKATWPLILSGSIEIILCLYDSYSSASSRGGFSTSDFIGTAMSVERIVPMILGVAFIVVGMTSGKKLLRD